MSSPVGASGTALAVANPWAVVPSLGNLDAYISAVNRLPMLTLEEEQEFARKFKESNDLEAAGNVREPCDPFLDRGGRQIQADGCRDGGEDVVGVRPSDQRRPGIVRPVNSSTMMTSPLRTMYSTSR